MEWLRTLVDPELYMPHGHCYLWQPGLVALQVGSNALIGASYFVITFTLIYLIRRITDIPFRRMYLAFGIFIVACGTTHLFDVVTVWRPLYWMDGFVRAITAVASVGTALLLPPLVPKALDLARAAKEAHDRGEQLALAHANLATAYEKARRDAEEAMRESAAWMQLLGETIPQIVWTATADGKSDYQNRRWEDYTGRASAEGPDWTESVHPDDVSHARERWTLAVKTKEPFEMEYRLRRADGAYRWHLARAVPLLDAQGNVRRWFGTTTDIDDQKRAIAELERAVKLRDDFLAVASHELRTPLTSLKLNVDLLLSRGATPTVTSIARQARRLARLVEQLLDVSRIANHGLELTRAPADLAAIAAEVVQNERDAAKAAGSELVLRVEEPGSGEWDAQRLELLLTNLVSNAIRYGRQKPIEMVVRGPSVTVRDYGMGIAPGDQERIFERFERAVPVRNYGGLGLGLWIARRIAEAHGGTLTVQSTPGDGAAFTLRLPRIESDDPKLADELRSSRAGDGPVVCQNSIPGLGDGPVPPPQKLDDK